MAMLSLMIAAINKHGGDKWGWLIFIILGGILAMLAILSSFAR